MARLFVAVWPPADVIEALRAMPRPDIDVRWTGEEQWHVTLRFLGGVDDAEVPDLAAALTAAADRCSAAAVTLGPPVRRRGTALALTVEGLDEIAAAVIDATAGFGQAPESRRFNGHLTIARTRRRRFSVEASLRASWTVTEVALVESHLGRGPGNAAQYETISVHELA